MVLFVVVVVLVLGLYLRYRSHSADPSEVVSAYLPLGVSLAIAALIVGLVYGPARLQELSDSLTLLN